jgi:hypothetical protein
LKSAIGPLEERTMSPDNVTTESTIRDIAYVDTGSSCSIPFSLARVPVY